MGNNKSKKLERVSFCCGGGEIRTHGGLTTTPVFKTGPLSRSGTPPILYFNLSWFLDYHKKTLKSIKTICLY